MKTQLAVGFKSLQSPNRKVRSQEPGALLQGQLATSWCPALRPSPLHSAYLSSVEKVHIPDTPSPILRRVKMSVSSPRAFTASKWAVSSPQHTRTSILCVSVVFACVFICKPLRGLLPPHKYLKRHRIPRILWSHHVGVENQTWSSGTAASALNGQAIFPSPLTLNLGPPKRPTTWAISFF